jgi:hypothetical protein
MQCPAVLAARRPAPHSVITCLCLVLGGLLGLGSPAPGMIGTIDAVPAATLLLPYFEVDVSNASGVNTLFSINNATDLAVLAHVTVWTDQSVPTLDFDVYLTGYDVQTINLRDVFVGGNVPITASVGQDPSDTISPKGPVSQDIDFSSCSGILPYSTGAISATFRAHLQAWLQGHQSPVLGNCAGSNQGNGILRGYVTVDTVTACNVLFPSDPPYFSVLTNQNALWGDVIYVDPSQGYTHGDTLVHIEACSTCFSPGDHTFYGRYNSNLAIDAREALPTTMAARYMIFNGQNNFLIWREANASASGYSCSQPGPPSWYPLQCTQILIFDEDEQVTDNDCANPWILNEANRLDVAVDLAAPYNAGWAYLNLQHPATAYADPYAQMWVTTMMDISGPFTGLYTAGFPGIQLDNANAPNTSRIPFP